MFYDEDVEEVESHVKLKELKECADYFIGKGDGKETPWQRHKRENYTVLKNDTLEKAEKVD